MAVELRSTCPTCSFVSTWGWLSRTRKCSSPSWIWSSLIGTIHWATATPRGKKRREDSATGRGSKSTPGSAENCWASVAQRTEQMTDRSPLRITVTWALRESSWTIHSVALNSMTHVLDESLLSDKTLLVLVWSSPLDLFCGWRWKGIDTSSLNSPSLTW